MALTVIGGQTYQSKSEPPIRRRRQVKAGIMEKAKTFVNNETGYRQKVTIIRLRVVDLLGGKVNVSFSLQHYLGQSFKRQVLVNGHDRVGLMIE